jgi:hypothetical protein
MAQELVLLTEWRERLKRQAESGLTVEAFLTESFHDCPTDAVGAFHSTLGVSVSMPSGAAMQTMGARA